MLYEILRYWHALAFGIWHSSKALTPTEIAKNALTAFYLLLLLVKRCWDVRGKEWDRIFFAKVTTRNLLKMLAHAILRLGHWCRKHAYEPCYTMEDAIEHFFSLLKTLRKGTVGNVTTGTTTIANSIKAAHVIHLRNHDKPKEAGSTRMLHEPIDIGPLALEALDEACTLSSICQVGSSMEQQRSELLLWWKTDARMH